MSESDFECSALFLIFDHCVPGLKEQPNWTRITIFETDVASGKPEMQEMSIRRRRWLVFDVETFISGFCRRRDFWLNVTVASDVCDVQLQFFLKNWRFSMIGQVGAVTFSMMTLKMMTLSLMRWSTIKSNGT